SPIRLRAFHLPARLPLICRLHFLFPGWRFRLGLCRHTFLGRYKSWAQKGCQGETQLPKRVVSPWKDFSTLKECGFGYGEDAQCVKCRPHRFKEDWGSQKCKPCLDCALLSRFQKANCSATGDAVCGDCLPGFYRKTKLVGFQDMECVPCGDPPPPYEPHCTSKVNLVRIPSTASSPRDTALAAVICSALATVLLALLVLCVIYCKRQFMEKKPSWSLRAQDLRCNGSELSCFDRPRLGAPAPRACCQCLRDSAQACGKFRAWGPLGTRAPRPQRALLLCFPVKAN
uniref:TNFR-Cys domain-containing protein n=1 Tax=Capra hircus TaxID=9925 RepID=A0A8C2NWW3_CAPHI